MKLDPRNRNKKLIEAVILKAGASVVNIETAILIDGQPELTVVFLGQSRIEWLLFHVHSLFLTVPQTCSASAFLG